MLSLGFLSCVLEKEKRGRHKGQARKVKEPWMPKTTSMSASMNAFDEISVVAKSAWMPHASTFQSMRPATSRSGDNKGLSEELDPEEIIAAEFFVRALHFGMVGWS